MKRRKHQDGIALITTLIMLSVVTLMAVAFLAVSRRERAAVTTTSDRIDAKAMADAAAQRAEAEIISRVLATTNLLSYEYLVSTNYYNPAGFDPGNTNIANVSYRYANGFPVTGNDLLQLYRNLQIDPRVPVYVVTNRNTGQEEFRYYLDYNRNYMVETNGVQREIDRSGRALVITNFHIGDPEWIGVLRRSDLPHSGSNHFIGRFAYMVLPAGRALDLNYIHNQAKRIGPEIEGFFRNQGVGSWEINLAAFLRDLNTNAWNAYDYVTNLGSPSRGVAFDNALELLHHRYRLRPDDVNPSYLNLTNVVGLFQNPGRVAFERDGIDGYSDGPLQLGINRPYDVNSGNPFENDNAQLPWPGADSPNQYFDLQESFTIPGIPYDQASFKFNAFTNWAGRMNQGAPGNVSRSTYDRHTFYRLLGQLGTDSPLPRRDRINLNYDNRMDLHLAGVLGGPTNGYNLVTNFVPWTAYSFFRTAGDRLVRTLNYPITNSFTAVILTNLPRLSVSNIPLWPTNYYSPAVHRALQLAANIHDATTNRGTTYPYLPSVFRPVFGPDPNVPGGIRIQDYVQIDTTFPWDLNLWNRTPRDLREPADRAALSQQGNALDRVPGIPVIIGAKKGYPNFNEFELQSVVVATRKLELVRRAPNTRPHATNQMYTLSISNVMGVEFWNSYTQAFPRPLQLRAHLEYTIVLSNEVRMVHMTNGVLGYTNTFNAFEWQGEQFQLPIHTNILFLSNVVYRARTGTLAGPEEKLGLNAFEPATGFPTPVWKLYVTNRLKAALIDMSVGGTGYLVDYVDLSDLNSEIDITGELVGETDLSGRASTVGSYWVTNRYEGMPDGVRRQIRASLGEVTSSEWNSVQADPFVRDKENAIARFRQFVGLATETLPVSSTLRMQVPLSPGIKLVAHRQWQVNDPLVNDLHWDLAQSNAPPQRLPPFESLVEDSSNLGKINSRYRPWQRSLTSSASVAEDFSPALKDPQITRSDDWDFPTNSFPSIGWLGRVHRGTPWQTVYLKSAAIGPKEWSDWSLHPVWPAWPGGILPLGTEPTNDWRILDEFTVAVNDNAVRGQLSVNQDGLAAWSAVLSGVPVLTNSFPTTNVAPAIIQPSSFELHTIVDGINFARSQRFGGKFNYMGEVLSTPELTLASPYLQFPTSIPEMRTGFPADPVIERIPQMILSLLRRDEPRFVILAFGQSLKPAPNSVVTEPGPYFQMPTNYMITGEFVAKTQVRLEHFTEPDGGTVRVGVRAITESYNEVPPTE